MAQTTAYQAVISSSLEFGEGASDLEVLVAAETTAREDLEPFPSNIFRAMTATAARDAAIARGLSVAGLTQQQVKSALAEWRRAKKERDILAVQASAQASKAGEKRRRKRKKLTKKKYVTGSRLPRSHLCLYHSSCRDHMLMWPVR